MLAVHLLYADHSGEPTTCTFVRFAVE